MYGNGGYLMIDFKNHTLSSGVKIDGITYENIMKCNKPLIVHNLKINDFMIKVSYVLSVVISDTRIILVLSAIAGDGIIRVEIDINDTINISNISIPVSTLNIESEVSTNASKSDSNISK